MSSATTTRGKARSSSCSPNIRFPPLLLILLLVGVGFVGLNLWSVNHSSLNQMMVDVKMTLSFLEITSNSDEDEELLSIPSKQSKQRLDESSIKSDNNDESSPMNIVLFYADDWRHDSVGYAGPQSVVKTPFLDWLAKKRGMRFLRNCVTTSVCWISRANMYTGQYVSRHKSTYPQHDSWYKYWNVSWPYMLRQAGYHIGHVGKWHSPNIDPIMKTWHFLRSYYGHHWYPTGKGNQKIHITKLNERDALAFLRQRPKNSTQPFMLNLCFFAPHSQDGSKEQYYPQNSSMSLYQDQHIPVPKSATREEWNKMPPFFHTGINEAQTRYKIRFDTPEKYQTMMKNYYRLISEIDETCKVIYQELEKQGVVNNTMIIFTTDNGLFHSEHQMAGKWYPHEESLRVPLVVYDPRMPRYKVGTVNHDFTLSIDLASTILGAANLKPSSVMQGRDLSDLYLAGTRNSRNGENAAANDRQHPWRQEFFYEHPVHLKDAVIPASTALVRKDIKYMMWPDHDYEQLFNLTQDPLEMNDLARREDMQHVLAEMRNRHNEFKLAVLRPGPIDASAVAMRGKAHAINATTSLATVTITS